MTMGNRSKNRTMFDKTVRKKLKMTAIDVNTWIVTLLLWQLTCIFIVNS